MGKKRVASVPGLQLSPQAVSLLGDVRSRLLQLPELPNWIVIVANKDDPIASRVCDYFSRRSMAWFGHAAIGSESDSPATISIYVRTPRESLLTSTIEALSDFRHQALRLRAVLHELVDSTLVSEETRQLVAMADVTDSDCMWPMFLAGLSQKPDSPISKLERTFFVVLGEGEPHLSDGRITESQLASWNPNQLPPGLEDVFPASWFDNSPSDYFGFEIKNIVADTRIVCEWLLKHASADGERENKKRERVKIADAEEAAKKLYSELLKTSNMADWGRRIANELGRDQPVDSRTIEKLPSWRRAEKAREIMATIGRSLRRAHLTPEQLNEVAQTQSGLAEFIEGLDEDEQRRLKQDPDLLELWKEQQKNAKSQFQN